MVPKRIKVLTTSTPSLAANPSATFGIASEVSDPSTISTGSFISGKIKVKPDAFSKMSTLEWVLKAIETVGVPRKGASYLAILKWIVNNKENVMINRLKTYLKKAIVKALENGLLKRPAISKDVTGLRGYFIINQDPVTVQKIPKTKTTRKLEEITNVIKVGKMKTAAALKTKAAAQPKSNPEKTVKPKHLPKSAKSNHDADAVEHSSKPKTKPKSKADKPKTDDEAGPSSKPKIQPKAKAAKPKTDDEVGPSKKLKTLPKSKSSKPNSNAGTVPSSRLKTQPKATEPNPDAKAGPSYKSKTQPRSKAVNPNLDTEAGPSSRLRTQPKSNTDKPNPDDKGEPISKFKTQPKSNIDTEAVPSSKPKTRPKADEPNLVSEDGPSSKPKTQPKAKAAKPNPDAEAGPSSKLKIQHKAKVAVKPRPGKLPVPVLKEILPSVAKKVPKAASKTKKATKVIHPKKSYKAPADLSLNISREEISDTESNAIQQHSNIRDDNRNSYASNQEPQVMDITKVAKATKVANNIEVTKLVTKETSEAGPSVKHAKKVKGKNINVDD